MKNIYLNIYKPNLANLKKAKKNLENNNIIGIPTETVYGLAGNAYSNKSSKKIFLAGCKLIGLLEEDLVTWKKFKKTKSKIDEKTIKSKIKNRENARKKGDYKLADSLRKELESAGVIIEDKGNKTTWRYK